MDKLIKWLENSFAPKLQKITNLTWIVVIKDSMMQLLHSGRLYLLRRHHPERLHSRSAQLLDSLRLDDEQDRPDGLLPDPL